jgi:hypothetical protein
MNDAGRVPGIHGSLLYTPPEGGPDDGDMGVTGDIYATGLTLFEMLNGPFPYGEISPEVAERRIAEGRRALPDSGFEHWDPAFRATSRQSFGERFADYPGIGINRALSSGLASDAFAVSTGSA